MNDTIKLLLFILGCALLGFGLYTIVTPDMISKIVGSAHESSTMNTTGQSIFLIIFGLIMLVGSVFSQQNHEIN